MGFDAEFKYGGGIVLSITCDICCDNEITHVIDDADELMYESLESKAESLMVNNKWERSCTCPECIGLRNEDKP